MTTWSKLPPRKPCYALFRGARHIRGGIYERINEPVEVAELVNGKERELVVMLTGRARKYPIAFFEGEWSQIVLEEL